MIGPVLPVHQKAVLLPFKDKVVYDGLLLGDGVRITWGPGIRRSLNEAYRLAKQRYGIVTSLPISADLPKAKPSKPKAKPSKPKAMPRPKAGPKALPPKSSATIVAMVEGFCREPSMRNTPSLAAAWPRRCRGAPFAARQRGAKRLGKRYRPARSASPISSAIPRNHRT